MDFAGIKTIAVVGISDKPERPSYQVASYLQANGFRIIPVNPTLAVVLGEKCYPDLASVPGDIGIDAVDIFRQAAEVGPVADQAMARGIPLIWMQEGVVNEEVAARARSHGLEVVMDKCMKKEHARLKEGR